eukprot:scaffold133183_cov30-Tisochrysis_lutea.AAC.13
MTGRASTAMASLTEICSRCALGSSVEHDRLDISAPPSHRRIRVPRWISLELRGVYSVVVLSIMPYQSSAPRPLPQSENLSCAAHPGHCRASSSSHKPRWPR